MKSQSHLLQSPPLTCCQGLLAAHLDALVSIPAVRAHIGPSLIPYPVATASKSISLLRGSQSPPPFGVPLCRSCQVTSCSQTLGSSFWSSEQREPRSYPSQGAVHGALRSSRHAPLFPTQIRPFPSHVLPRMASFPCVCPSRSFFQEKISPCPLSEIHSFLRKPSRIHSIGAHCSFLYTPVAIYLFLSHSLLFVIFWCISWKPHKLHERRL